MKKFTVSVSAEPLKESVRVEVPRAIVYDVSKGVLKLDGTHPHIKRIREIVDEYVTMNPENDWDGAKRDALSDELAGLTSEEEAFAVHLYDCNAYKAKCDARDKAAAEKWLADLAKKEKAGLELCDIPGWCDGSGVIYQMFEISRNEKRKNGDPLDVALNRVFYYGYLSGQKA